MDYTNKLKVAEELYYNEGYTQPKIIKTGAKDEYILSNGKDVIYVDLDIYEIVQGINKSKKK